MRLRGKIDRVDLYEDEEHVYVKVIDYKTGAKAFQLGEMYHGLQLQLIVYLNAVMEMEEQKHPEKEIVPAGIFYYQMKDPFVEKEVRENLGEKAVLKEIKTRWHRPIPQRKSSPIWIVLFRGTRM
mgnify:CR=1 FL=1